MPKQTNGLAASLPLTALEPLRYFKKYQDPTSAHIPVLAKNHEAILFRHTERFRYVDGTTFNFRGLREHNRYDKGGTRRTATDERAPHSQMTMRDLNNSVPDGISDHAPITVDLSRFNPQR